MIEKLKTFLVGLNKTRFDLICVFSVTMWIHLNHGDKGLRTFINMLCRQTRFLLLEPQPWKCYQTAARRMRKLGQQEFEKMKDLEIRGPEVEQPILKMCGEEGMTVEVAFGETKWNRKLLLLKHGGKLSENINGLNLKYWEWLWKLPKTSRKGVWTNIDIFRGGTQKLKMS